MYIEIKNYVIQLNIGRYVVQLTSKSNDTLIDEELLDNGFI